MVLTASCLIRKTVQGNNKLLLLGSRHALSNKDIKKSHLQDMDKLLKIIGKNPYRVPFLIELCEPQKDPERLKSMLRSPENIAVKLALDSNMKHGNIDFIPIDTRKRYDCWMIDMICYAKYVAQALEHDKNKDAFLPEFYTITGKNLLVHLNTRYVSNIELITSIPASTEIVDKYLRINEQRYKQCRNSLSFLLTVYGIDHNEHIFNLIRKLCYKEITELHFFLAEEHSFTIDMNILQKTLLLSESNPLCIISSGVYHSYTTEKRLLSDFSGFEKDVASSMMLPGMKANSLSTMVYPTAVPYNFMNKDMERFISDYLNE
jgi:hypothetical protein